MSEQNSSSAPLAQAPPAFPEAAPARRGRRKRRLAWIAGVTAGLLVLASVGAWATYTRVFGSDGGAADSAQALPAGTIMMVEFSIEPSTQQKLLLAKMGDRLDGLQNYLDSTDINVSLDKQHSTELRPAIWNAIIDKGNIDTSLDYDKDIAPWLGGRMALGMVGGTDNPIESWIVAIESKNDKAGVEATRTFIADALPDGGGEVQVEARNGYVIVAPNSLDLDAAFADGVLADQPAFKHVVKRLGDRGLGSYWVGTYAATEAIADWSRKNDRETSRLLSDALDDISADAGQGMVIRAFDGGIESLAVASGSPASPSLTSGGGAGTQIGMLPDTTAFAFSVQQAGSLLDTMLTREYLASSGMLTTSGDLGGMAALAGAIEGVSEPGIRYEDLVSTWTKDFRKDFEKALGLDIPDEVNTAFGSGIVMAVDEDLNCDLEGFGGDCDEPNLALVIHTRDIDATTGAIDDLMDEVGISSRDADYTVARDDSRVVFGAGDYVDVLTEDSPDPLSRLPSFRRALPDADSATIAMYVSVGGILSIAEDNGADLDSDIKDAIGDFAAIGMTSTIESDGTTLARYRIVLAD